MFRLKTSSDVSPRQISSQKIALNYITKNFSSSFSLARLEANNVEEQEKILYDRGYYVLEGKMELDLDGESVTLEKDDSIYITKGTDYIIRGTFKSILINSPSFGTIM